jgi:hypothetical protein
VRIPNKRLSGRKRTSQARSSTAVPRTGLRIEGCLARIKPISVVIYSMEFPISTPSSSSLFATTAFRLPKA